MIEWRSPPASDGQISCQYKPTRKIVAMFLYHLQIEEQLFQTGFVYRWGL